MSDSIPAFVAVGKRVVWKHTGCLMTVSDTSQLSAGEGWVGVASGNPRYPVTWLRLEWLRDPSEAEPARVKPPQRAATSFRAVAEIEEAEELPPPPPLIVRARPTITTTTA